MNLARLFVFSFQALRGHRVRAGLSLLAIAIGVAAVVLLTSLGEGTRRYVVGEFTSMGSNLLIITPGRTETSGVGPMLSEAPNDLTIEDSEAILRQVGAVRKIAPVALGGASVRFGKRTRQVSVIGSDGSFFEVRNLDLATGRPLPMGATGVANHVCVIGSTIQREVFDGENPLGQMLRIGDYRFRVVGVLADKGTTLGIDVDDMVYVPVSIAMRIFNRTSLFRILAEVGAHQSIETAQRDVIAVLNDRHDGEEDFTVFTQGSLLSTFDEILRMLTAALAGIAAISLSVAGIGVMNVMLITVVERTSEIGLLKAVGATRRQIVSVFLIEAAILSSIGGVVGLLIGLGAGDLVRRVYPEFPVHAPLWAAVAAVALSIAIGLIFGALPARRAARLDPIVALNRK